MKDTQIDELHRAHGARERGNIPDRADGAVFLNLLRNFERSLQFDLGSSSDGLFDEHGDTREELHDLHLDIPPRFAGTAEHGWRAHDDGLGAVSRRHVLDEVLQGAEDASVLVRRPHESFAFLLQHLCGTLNSRVDECNDFETGAEFAR